MSPSVQETIENYHASDDFAMLYCYIVIQIKLNVLVVALGPVYMEASQPGKRAGSLYRDLGSPYILCKKTH